MILVTGASGFVGQHLVQYLSAQGKPVRALYNSHPPKDELLLLPNISWMQCDLLDVYAVEAAMEGIEDIYHCAAVVSFAPGDKQRMLHFNVEATANIVNEAIARNVRKILYVSSIASLGRNAAGKEITEEEEWQESKHNSIYSLSKYNAELEIWRGIGEGLDAVIINPGIILGEGNWDEGSARLIKVVYKEFPFYTEGINGWVDVKDVAATYTGLFTPIRELLSGTQEARSRGYQPGRFSFNVKGGRCEACQGDGVIKVEMHFLPDVYVPCDVCKGKRYNRETLEVKYKGKNIHEILEMTVEDAREFFDPVPAVARKLQTLMDVGLSYIRLGQSATTLSGGEAQRVKLARELSKRDTGQTLYILDEPTTGLHFHDIQQLLKVLHQLRDRGNTIVIIEHNLDVIKTADWIVDLGPEGGAGGGRILVTGTPEEMSRCKESHTARFLAPLLGK